MSEEQKLWADWLAAQTAMRLSDSTTPYLYFADWQRKQDPVCGCSTRLGGVSTGALSSLNLSYSRGDAPERVLENYKRLGRAVGFLPERFVIGAQNHGVHVHVVTETDAGNGVTTENRLADTDALVTEVPGLLLCVSVADCVPLYFYDPLKRVVGIAHAGWRGTVFGIADQVVKTMYERFGCQAQHLRAAIGPSISQSAYEVDSAVLRALGEQCSHIDYETALQRQNKDSEHALLDLWQVNRLRLMAAGVPSEQITVGGVCTRQNSRFLFSHRATAGQRGNLNGFIGLRE
ncbi:MAG: peptidoglycan editing factor PgeF [Lachnospiraceae bacterium]|nr:peptidoglycan editing factor PgeF [Lachnospiraceae bacterium]MDY5741727.1 peptidoglycan editing factor PgeF [Lachnospiraceae bacterium]